MRGIEIMKLTPKNISPFSDIGAIVEQATG
jgi:hypothetical protein